MAFTFFFRDRHTLEHLSRLLAEYTDGFAHIKIWDAGSAMGPEPYTFAMIFAETIGSERFKRVRIIASDIDESGRFGKTIEDGIYPKSDLVRMPDDIFSKYFERADGEDKFQVVSRIKKSLSFIKHDLLTLKPFDRNFHAIICKNVLLHFQPAERVEVIKMYYECLETGGYFITEQTQQLPEECGHMFEKAVPDANIYKRIG